MPSRLKTFYQVINFCLLTNRTLKATGSGMGCSRSGVFWTRSQDGEGAKTRSERSHDGEASVAEGICRSAPSPKLKDLFAS